MDTARPRTNKARSNIERVIIFDICGFRYGGNSRVYDDGTPFSIVDESAFVTKNVTKIPRMITKVSNKDDSRFPPSLIENPMISIEISVIMVGNLPLHGTKLFVSIASSFSRGESIILHPTTPAALQPNPIHIVSACFPQALQHLNGLSRLNAIRGKNPKSSNRVKRGKNIAIGGNITDTTHATVLNIPRISRSCNQIGGFKNNNPLLR